MKRTMFRKTLAAVVLLSAAVGLTPADAGDVAGDVVTIDGRAYQVTGASTAPGVDPVYLGDADGVLELVGGVVEALPVPAPKPCVPAGSDITIGDLTGTGLADLGNPGDIYYRWKVPTTVKIKGSCDKTTISTVTYTDTPVITTGGAYPTSGGPYQVRGSGDVTVLQAPEWLVLYYSARNIYTRALFGSFTATVHAGYVDAKTNVEVLKFACTAKTWYFWATPQGPSYTTSTQTSNC